jgi:hypothetical protein
MHLEKRCFANIKMFPNTIFIKTFPKGDSQTSKEYVFTSFLKNGRKFTYNLVKPFAVNLQMPLITEGTILITSSDTSSSHPSGNLSERSMAVHCREGE